MARTKKDRDGAGWMVLVVGTALAGMFVRKRPFHAIEAEDPARRRQALNLKSSDESAG